MTTLVESRTYQLGITMDVRSSTGQSYTEKFGYGVHSEGRSRTVLKVDPVNKLLHGYHQSRSVNLSPLPYVHTVLKYQQGTSPAAKKFVVDCAGLGFAFSLPTLRPLYSDESSKIQLIERAIKGAMDEQVNVAMFIGELSKTADLLADSSERIASAMHAVRSGKFSTAAKLLKVRKPKGARRSKTFANNWLEFTYGWSPIVSDMLGSMKHISTGARELLIKPTSRTQWRMAEIPWTSPQIQIAAQGASQHRQLLTWKYSGVWEVKEQVALVFRPTSWFWDQVNRTGFMDPGTLVYESIPGSFMLDWFSNLGDWLAAMNLGLTLEYVTGSYTQLHELRGTLDGDVVVTDLKPGTYTYTGYNVSVADSIHKAHLSQRDVLYESEVVVSLALDAPFSVNRAITGAALVVQQLTK